MKYVLPEISDDGSSTSSVKVEGMRHPVIERLVRDEWPYIPHSLGLEGDGYLLYGVNSSGKSSIMKAMGVCVILAQAGYAVPCTKMELCPYTAIFTRISGSDDMYRGLSSFTVELTELDRIIRDAGPQSLVLGDEVCRGTESVSGCAIVGAALGMLTSRKCSFVFATHLHELMSREEIRQDPRIRVAHLRVDEDHSQGDRLVFHRDLQPGSGRPVYGATVARHVIRNVEFGRCMEGFLNPPRLVLPKTSRYNAKKHITHCEKCSATDVPLHIHHVIPQKDADEKGFIKGTALHKNCLWNLLGLCEKCHQEAHHLLHEYIYEV
jgi:DNA mismatch repair protein MutS